MPCICKRLNLHLTIKYLAKYNYNFIAGSWEYFIYFLYCSLCKLLNCQGAHPMSLDFHMEKLESVFHNTNSWHLYFYSLITDSHNWELHLYKSLYNITIMLYRKSYSFGPWKEKYLFYFYIRPSCWPLHFEDQPICTDLKRLFHKIITATFDQVVLREKIKMWTSQQ